VSRTTTATSAQKSTAQSVQQMPNQTQTFSAIQAPNQMMMMGGMGGVGGIGRVGAGLGEPAALVVSADITKFASLKRRPVILF